LSVRAKEDYISVVAHYVDKKWQLEEKQSIIGFKLIYVLHTGEDIAWSLLKVVENFGLANKIFAVSLYVIHEILVQ
jgi:hypothetical protein